MLSILSAFLRGVVNPNHKCLRRVPAVWLIYGPVWVLELLDREGRRSCLPLTGRVNGFLLTDTPKVKVSVAISQHKPSSTNTLHHPSGLCVVVYKYIFHEGDKLLFHLRLIVQATA